MKYIDEFRDPALAKHLSQTLQQTVIPDRRYRFMEFCGGHTHAIFRYGIPDLLPDNIQMVHGPGCPVCVLPISRLDMAIELTSRQDVILCSYGDMLRVPASRRRSLLQARAEGADVRMVYSCMDALQIARDNPQRQVVFFAIGFETTTPPTALIILQAQALGIRNFSVLCNHVLTPAAMRHMLETPLPEGAPVLDGFVGPAHVSTVIGSEPYRCFAEQYHKPVVIAGFEPLDLMQAILMLVRQVNEGRCAIENEFTRAVTPRGNQRAIDVMQQVFEVRPSFAWRGLGEVTQSALSIREEFAGFDAEKRFSFSGESGRENSACACGSVLQGLTSPPDCSLFGDPCTPENPLGACMVSSEGACAAHYRYASRQIASDRTHPA